MKTRIEFSIKPKFSDYSCRGVRSHNKRMALVTVKIFGNNNYVVHWSGKGNNDKEALKNAILSALAVINYKFSQVRIFAPNGSPEPKRIKGSLETVCQYILGNNN